MPTRYGPAVVMALIIGSAIMLDDVLMFNLHGEHHAPMKHAQMQREKVFEIVDDGAVEAHQVIVKVHDGDGETSSEAIELAIKTAIETAANEGRKPSPDELDAVIKAAISDQHTEQLDINIEINE
ncbi:MAG: hypothetical protein VW865_05715 [Halieaceae bacterium]|jgi:hypothetical protein